MKKRILIVDFEEQFVEELRSSLRNENFELVTATDGTQALRIFDSQTPDLVLTTALLPKLNGFELCRKITSGELGEIRPVIMYSAIYKADKYRKEAIAGCGALEFLDTPISKSQLMKVIDLAFSEIPAGKNGGTTTSPARLVSAVGLANQPRPQVSNETEDLLGINELFSIEPERLPKNTLLEREAAVLESMMPEPSALISNIDSSEIDAAVDAFRMDIDVDHELRQRDQMLAKRFEEQLLRDGQTILEFESSQGNPGAGISENLSGSELEELVLDGGLSEEPDAMVTSTASRQENRPETTAGTLAPEFSPRPKKNWWPLLTAVVLAGLACLIVWLVLR
jgi:DNA-binding response OmpR family regulator